MTRKAETMIMNCPNMLKILEFLSKYPNTWFIRKEIVFFLSMKRTTCFDNLKKLYNLNEVVYKTEKINKSKGRSYTFWKLKMFYDKSKIDKIEKPILPIKALENNFKNNKPIKKHSKTNFYKKPIHLKFLNEN